MESLLLKEVHYNEQCSAEFEFLMTSLLLQLYVTLSYLTHLSGRVHLDTITSRSAMRNIKICFAECALVFLSTCSSVHCQRQLNAVSWDSWV